MLRVDRSRGELRAHVEFEEVVAQPQDDPEPARGSEVLLHERRGVGLPDQRVHAGIGHLPAAGQPRAALHLPQAGGDVVVAELCAQAGAEGHASEVVEPVVPETGEEGGALVVLLDLVPLDRVDRLEGEVIEQRQAVPDGGKRRAEGGPGVRVGDEGEDPLLALRIAAFRGIDRSVPVELPRVHEARRDLSRADPARCIGRREQRKRRLRRHAPRRLGEQVVPLQLLRVEERTARSGDLGREIRLEIARERAGDAQDAISEELA